MFLDTVEEISAKIVTMDTQMWMEMAVMLTKSLLVENMMTMILIQWPCAASVEEELGFSCNTASDCLYEWMICESGACVMPPAECADVWSQRKCEKRKSRRKCGHQETAAKCTKTCELCDEVTTTPAPPTTTAPPPTPTGTKNVLWIGNSYTSYNNLAGMVKSLAESDGKSIQFGQRLGARLTWGNHAASQTTINKIKSKKWDVVVLQEQSQIPAKDEWYVCMYSVVQLQRLMDAIRENSADTVVQFYGTWGRPNGERGLTYDQMQNLLSQRYQEFACMVSAPSRLAPVGEGFRTYGALYGDQARLSLYNRNGRDHHSSKKGSYLAACIHFLAIYGDGANVIGNNYTAGLDVNTAKTIQEVAQKVWNNGVDWNHATDDDCQSSMC